MHYLKTGKRVWASKNSIGRGLQMSIISQQAAATRTTHPDILFKTPFRFLHIFLQLSAHTTETCI